MPQASDLYELIHALSPAEKRLFKLRFSNGSDTPVYLQLFDLLAKQKTCDEKALGQMMKTHRVNMSVSVLKSYLREQIIRFLKDTAKPFNPEEQVNELLREAALLEKKGLQEQSRKLLHKAGKLAGALELHDALLAINEKEIGWMIAKNYAQQKEEKLDQLFAEQKRLLALKQLETEYKQLKSKVFFAYRRKENKQPSGEDPFLIHFSNPLLCEPEKAITFHSLYLFYECRVVYHMYMKEYEQSAAVCRQWQKHVEAHPLICAAYPRKYFVALNCHATAAFALNNNKLLAALTAKMRAVKMNTRAETLSVLLICHNAELLLYLNDCDFGSAITLIEKEAAILWENTEATGKAKAAHCFTIYSLSYFIAGEYSKALTWINRALNLLNTEVSYEYLLGAKLLELFIHYELGHKKLLQSKLRAAERTAKQVRTMNFSMPVILFLKQVVALKGDAVQSYYQTYWKENAPFKFITDDTAEMLDLNFKYWLQSKIEKRPLAVIYRAEMSKKRRK